MDSFFLLDQTAFTPPDYSIMETQLKPSHPSSNYQYIHEQNIMPLAKNKTKWKDYLIGPDINPVHARQHYCISKAHLHSFTSLTPPFEIMNLLWKQTVPTMGENNKTVNWLPIEMLIWFQGEENNDANWKQNAYLNRKIFSVLTHEMTGVFRCLIGALSGQHMLLRSQLNSSQFSHPKHVLSK